MFFSAYYRIIFFDTGTGAGGSFVASQSIHRPVLYASGKSLLNTNDTQKNPAIAAGSLFSPKPTVFIFDCMPLQEIHNPALP